MPRAPRESAGRHFTCQIWKQVHAVCGSKSLCAVLNECEKSEKTARYRFGRLKRASSLTRSVAAVDATGRHTAAAG